MKRALALVCVAIAGFAAACGSSGKNKTNPTIDQPPPQPTTSTQKTGTPSTPRGTTTSMSSG